MLIRVLVADDNDTLRSVIVRVLKEDADLRVVGEATTFAQTVELTTALKPDVLLLDLLMPDENAFSPGDLKLQLLHGAGCILAMSIWNGDDARARADSLGAKALLDKGRLLPDLIPSIKLFCPLR
jgi:chemotaxis response regulator CheB